MNHQEWAIFTGYVCPTCQGKKSSYAHQCWSCAFPEIPVPPPVSEEEAQRRVLTRAIKSLTRHAPGYRYPMTLTRDELGDLADRYTDSEMLMWRNMGPSGLAQLHDYLGDHDCQGQYQWRDLVEVQ